MTVQIYTHFCTISSIKTGKVLVCKSNILKVKKNSLSVHAEKNAIICLLKKIKTGYIRQKELSKGVHLFSYRMSHRGVIGNGKPCKACVQSMFKLSNLIKTVQWVDSQGETGNVIELENININDHKKSNGDLWINGEK